MYMQITALTKPLKNFKMVCYIVNNIFNIVFIDTVIVFFNITKNSRDQRNRRTHVV